MTIPETAPWTTPLDVHRHGTATAGADKDNGPVTIGFGLGGADSLVPVVIGEGRVDDLVAVLGDQGWLHPTRKHHGPFASPPHDRKLGRV